MWENGQQCLATSIQVIERHPPFVRVSLHHRRQQYGCEVLLEWYQVPRVVEDFARFPIESLPYLRVVQAEPIANQGANRFLLQS